MSTPWEIRYARASDGIDVAYATYGDGPRDVVLIHGFTTHLDFVGDSAWHSYWIRRLGEHFRVIVLDKRGTGLSDRTLGHGSIEDRMRDVLAVMDAVGSDAGVHRGHLRGRPDRAHVRGHLSRTGRQARPVRHVRPSACGPPTTPSASPPRWPIRSSTWVGEAWGNGESIGTVFITHAPDVEAAMRSMSKFERNACTPQMAVEILRRNLEIDVRDLLPGIAAPTLVMHNVGDPLVPVGLGATSPSTSPVRSTKRRMATTTAPG